MASPQILTSVVETENYALVDKPALLDSQNSRPDRPSVVEWARGKFGFPGLVHRLDFGTSGLLLCAKNAEAAALLARELQEGRINRQYLGVAIGSGLPEHGKIDLPLDGKPAVTRYRVVERLPNAMVLELELETGRKHQIRRHLFESGHPLLGDHLYKKGGSDRLFHRPALHAHALTVFGKTYRSPPPADLEGLLARLRKTR